MNRAPRPRPVAFHGDERRAGRRLHDEGATGPVVRTGFDVSAYTIAVGGRIPVDGEAVAAEAERLAPGPVAALRRDLEYLARVESAALSEVRTLYSSWTVNEARITAFLATWLWDRLWWARALDDLAAALPAPMADGAAGAPRGERAQRLTGALRRTYVERAMPLMGFAWSRVLGEAVTAGHMARLLLQEEFLGVGIRAVASRLEPGETTRVLRAVAERRETALPFFRLETHARATRSAREARTARAVLAVGGDPLRPAGQRVEHERAARASIFRGPEDRATLQAVRADLTALLREGAAGSTRGRVRGFRPA